MEDRDPVEYEDLFGSLPAPVPAAKWKRLVNYFVDSVLAAMLLVTIVQVVGSVSKEAATRIMATLTEPGIGNLYIVFFYVVVMSFTETAFRGKSLGKLITGTRAVMRDGSRVPTQTVFLRNLLRGIPFEPLSTLIFPSPWHDSLSRTLVAEEPRPR